MPGDVVTTLYSLDEFKQQLKSGTISLAIALDLSGTQSQSQANDLFKFLARSDSIVLERLELDVRYNGLDSESFINLKKLLESAHCPRSLHLDLRHNDISDQTIATLVTNFTATRPGALQLDLAHNHLSDASMQVFATWLTQAACPLEALSFEGNRITTEGMNTLLQALKENRSLKSLSLGVIACDTIVSALHITRVIKEMLEHNTHLLAVDLRFDFPAASSAPANRELERQLREDLRFIDNKLATNNSPVAAEYYETTIAIEALSRTTLGTFESVIATPQHMIRELTKLIPLDWRYRSGAFKAAFVGVGNGQNFVNDLNRVLHQKKAGFSIKYEALPSPTIVVFGLKNAKQLESLITQQTRLNALVHDLAPTLGI